MHSVWFHPCWKSICADIINSLAARIMGFISFTGDSPLNSRIGFPTLSDAHTYVSSSYLSIPKWKAPIGTIIVVFEVGSYLYEFTGGLLVPSENTRVKRDKIWAELYSIDYIYRFFSCSIDDSSNESSEGKNPTLVNYLLPTLTSSDFLSPSFSL